MARWWLTNILHTAMCQTVCSNITIVIYHCWFISDLTNKSCYENVQRCCPLTVTWLLQFFSQVLVLLCLHFSCLLSCWVSDQTNSLSHHHDRLLSGLTHPPTLPSWISGKDPSTWDTPVRGMWHLVLLWLWFERFCREENLLLFPASFRQDSRSWGLIT